MKKKLIYLLLIILSLIFLIANHGFLQATHIKINDIVIIKPYWTKYSVQYLYATSSKAVLHNDLIRNKYIYDIKQNSIAILKFENTILHNKVIIMLFYNKPIKKEISQQVCTDYKILKESDKYIIDKIQHRDNIVFSIEADRKEDLVYYYRQICD